MVSLVEDDIATEVVVSPAPDCLSCAVCCREAADGRVLVSEEDLERWQREGRADILSGLVPGHFGQQGFPAHPDGTCLHLGLPGDPYRCSIYGTRGWSCRALAPGSRQCLTFRRLAGLEAGPGGQGD